MPTPGPRPAYLRRLKVLEEENRNLKQLVAEPETGQADAPSLSHQGHLQGIPCGEPIHGANENPGGTDLRRTIAL